MKKIFFAMAMLLASSPAFAQIVRSTTFTQQPKEKKEKTPTEWFIRVGVSCNNLTGDAMSEMKDAIKEVEKANDDENKYSANFGHRVGFEFTTGFNKHFGKSNLYWGMELGIGSRGGSFSLEYENDYFESSRKCYASSYNVKYSPFTFGYKFPVTNDIKIDAHLGIYASFDFSGKYVEDAWSQRRDQEKETFNESWDLFEECTPGDEYRIDAGLQLGIGVWYKKFNVNFTWQRGFIDYLSKFPFRQHVYKEDNHRQLYYNSSNAIISIAYAF